MQIFTIGLYELHPNGTYKRDAAGAAVPTYDNDDIMVRARVDRLRPPAASAEYRGGERVHGNWIDPMAIEADWRDVFPKMDLRDGFIGDRYPLCADAPPRAFLRAGATWRYLGQNPLPDLASDPSSFATLRTKRFAPDPRSSALHAALCNATNATCRFRARSCSGPTSRATAPSASSTRCATRAQLVPPTRSAREQHERQLLLRVRARAVRAPRVRAVDRAAGLVGTHAHRPDVRRPARDRGGADVLRVDDDQRPQGGRRARRPNTLASA